MDYIKLPRLYEKLRKAESFYSPVIMTAATGWGKSAAVQYYYRRKKTFLLRCREGKLDRMPDLSSIRENIIIVEDMQWLSEKDSIDYLKRLLHDEGRQVVMLTRGTVPKYLVSEDISLGFVRIQEADLTFGPDEIKVYFEKSGIELEPEEVTAIAEYSHGYVCALHCCAARLANGEHYSAEVRTAVWHDIFHLWDGSVNEQWSKEFADFALGVCRYESFTTEMVRYLTGNSNPEQIIEYCRETMSQLRYRADGHYSFRDEIRAYYCWKQELTWSKEEIIENYRRGANFYEMHGDIPNALKFYKLAGATQRIKELLIRNAYSHPGNGHYIETRDYYLELPKGEIVSVPVLMAGMSMLHSLILQPELSESWYRELEAFADNELNSLEKRREAKVWLAYLDIGLPHRGTKGIFRVLRNAFNLITKGNIRLPEFSVTGNMPSIMNGGLDLCEWAKNDTQIIKFISGSLETITGKHGKGLITILAAECGFEKGSMGAYEVLTRLNDGFEAASYGGKIEICFASVGIQVKQHLVEGQMPSAERICSSFRLKIEEEKADQLMPNFEAFETCLSLYSGQSEKSRDYIEKITDARVSFCILDRYTQMVKLRCLIAENRLHEALDLANFLTGYLVSYERNHYWMENELLKSIILYRLEDEHWKEHIKNALYEAYEYKFRRLISLEGAALLPLLKEILELGELSDMPEDYLSQIFEECSRLALFYPDYLKFIPKETVELTKRETEVLSLLCSGMPMDEICIELKISYDGLKKHNRNIYKKLGAKNRAEAERKAGQLGLIHRGGNG
ncbi:MAG: LuxR C-terminal-related transcriptional regulator [Lachnospiraceae bacterium]|nr:LuxR C-terminal-related transcriptional regulator [Lachnospiraceae bacterium]